jgi:uncharacterized protein (DUF433 family)
MPEAKTYVSTDEFGVMRVGSTRVMLDGVIASFEEGHSPETIRSQYPSLTLEEVYGAITYCLANREEIKAYVKKQKQIWQELRAEQDKNISPVAARIRALMKARAEAP